MVTVDRLVFELDGDFSKLRASMVEAARTTSAAQQAIQNSFNQTARAQVANEQLLDAYQKKNLAGIIQVMQMRQKATAQQLQQNEQISRSAAQALAAERAAILGRIEMFSNLGGAILNVTNLLIAMGTVKAAETFIEMSDSAILLRARLVAVSDSTKEGNDLFNKLFQISQDTRQSFEQTVTVFTRMARSVSTVTASNEDLLTVVKTMNNALLIGGANAQEASNALLDFSHALNQGGLNGREARQVFQQFPDLLRAIIAGIQKIDPALGLTQENFYKMVSQHKITNDLMIKGIQSVAPEYQKLADAIPRTVGQSIQQLKNDVLKSFDVVNQQGNLTPQMTEVIDKLRKMMTSPEFISGVKTIATSLINMMSYAVTHADLLIKIFGVLAGAKIGALGNILGPEVGAVTTLGGAGAGYLLANNLTGGGAHPAMASSSTASLSDAIAAQQKRVAGIADPGSPEYNTAVARLRSLQAQQGSTGGDHVSARPHGVPHPEIPGLDQAEKQIEKEKDENKVLQLIADGHKDIAEQMKFENQIAETMGGKLLPDQKKQIDGIFAIRQKLQETIGVNDELKSLDKQIAAQKILNTGDKEKIDAQQIINTLEDKYGKLTDAEVKSLTDKVSLLEQIRAEGVIDETQREVEQELRLIDALQRGQQAYLDEKAAIDAENQARALGLDVGSDKARQLMDEIRLRDQLKDKIDQAQEQQKQLKQNGADFANVISTAFEDAVLNGGKLSDVLKALEKDIARILLRLAFTKPLENALSGGSGGSDTMGIITTIAGALVGAFGGGGFSSSEASAAQAAVDAIPAGQGAASFASDEALADLATLAPGRAIGGPVMANQPYIVGEHGTELFVPGSSGTIIPKGKWGNGMPNITMNLVVPQGMDPRGFRPSVGPLAAAVARRISSAAIRNA